MPPLETPGHSWAGLGHSVCGSLLLSPGSGCTQASVCALQKSISQSCVSSGSSMVGLMATSSKRTYAIHTPRAPVPAADHCPPVPPQEMLKHSSVSVSVGSLGPGAQALFDSKCKLAPPTILLGLLLCPWIWGYLLTASLVKHSNCYRPWTWAIYSWLLQ